MYDSMNRLIETINPLLGISTITYNADGQVATQLDQLGYETAHTYDTRGWQTVTQSGGLVSGTVGGGGVIGGGGGGGGGGVTFSSTTTSTYDVMGNQITRKSTATATRRRILTIRWATY